MQVNIHDAKSQLSRLVAAAEAGEEVVIARAGRPAVRLVPVPRAGFAFDKLRPLASRTPDFEEPLPDEELELWEGGR